MVLHAYKMLDPATVYYARATHLTWWNRDWNYYLAVAQAELGRSDLAVGSFQQATWIGKGSFAVQYRLGTALLRSGRPADALPVFVSLVAQDPAMPWAHFGLAETRLATGDLRGAIQAYQRACELFPPFKRAHYALAIAFQRVGDTTNAAEHRRLYALATASQPPLPDELLADVVALERGALHHATEASKLAKAGKLRDAARELESGLEIDPGHTVSHINLITLYDQLNDMERAEAHFNAAVRTAPDRADAYYEWGKALAVRSRHEDAARMYRRTLEIDDAYPEAHYGLAVLLDLQSKTDEAVRQCELALAARPDYSEARTLLERLQAQRR